MVAMDREQWQRHAQVWIHVVDRSVHAEVDGRIGDETDRDGFISEAVLPQQRHTTVQRTPGRFVVVEEVASQQQHVDPMGLGQT